MFKIDSYDFKGKRAIIRVDFNVPLDDKGLVLHICGDMQEYGWVYIGTHGRGIVTGVPAS